MLWRSTVQRENSAQPIGFTPQHVQAFASGAGNDAIFWVNEDQTAVHQPHPQGGAKDAWGPEIPPHESSSQLNLDQAGTYAYACAIHPDETGTIVVANGIVIAPDTGGSAATPFPATPEKAKTVFSPATQTVNAGESAAWGNSTSETHQLQADNGDWATIAIEPGAVSDPIPFATAGTSTYHCALHPTETGTIVVS
ncbi:MAG TPA: hypothetical protein VF698_11395 [Thermoanaerobaculia bacterium]|jgi:plastocyanin